MRARQWGPSMGVALVWGAAALMMVAGQMVQAAPASVAAYFPLTEGTAWVYRTNTSGQVIMRVGKTMPVGQGVCRLIETLVGGSPTQVECYRVASDGVYAHHRRYAAGSVVLEPPQRVLGTPVQVGTRWQWAGRMGEQEIVIHYTWARRESVAVVAGTYEAMQLYFDGILGAETRVQTWRWFAPGVGMIKEDSLIVKGAQSLRIYAELVSMTKGQ